MNASTRPGTPGDVNRFASFLPMWRLVEGDEGLLAEVDRPSRIVGCSLLGARLGDDGQPLYYIDVTVLPRFREDGTLTQLIAPLIERAAQRGAREVHLATPRTAGTQEVVAFAELGFVEYRSLVTYEFSMVEFAARTRATYERLVQRGSIPESARVTGLTAAHWPAAVELLRAEKLMDAATQERAEREGLHDHFCASSSVVTLAGEVKGVALNHARGRTLETSAMAVDPRLRGGGWINAFMTWRASEVALALGYEVLTMAADPVRHPMTTRLARRMNALQLQAQLMLKRTLTKEVST